jgi:hypothetical protein
MENPESPTEKPRKAPVLNVREVLQYGNSPWDNISQLSQPSSSGVSALKSPLKANDVGIPTTPEGRVIVAIDERAIDQGYDSDRRLAPWEEGKSLNLKGPEEDEEPLPFGPGASSSLEPLAKNVAEK